MSQPKRIWCVLPCYFDVEPFLRVRREVLETAHALPLRTEVSFMLIDDSAGRDPAVARLVAGLSDVYVLSPPYNLGSQAGLVYALRSLGGIADSADIIITLDSDGEDRPSDIPRLIEPLLRDIGNLHQVSLARRTYRVETLMFKFCYLCFRTMFRMLTGTVIRNGNFSAFRGWLLREVVFHPHFDQCYASSFVSLPLEIEYVPIARGPRYSGKSKTSYTGLFSHGFRMLMPFTERIAVRGLLFSFVLSGLSVGSMAFSLALGSRIGMGSACVLVVSVLLIGVFGLLFATFSQTKSRSLRGLSDAKLRARAPEAGLQPSAGA